MRQIDRTRISHGDTTLRKTNEDSIDSSCDRGRRRVARNGSLTDLHPVSHMSRSNSLRNRVSALDAGLAGDRQWIHLTTEANRMANSPLGLPMVNVPGSRNSVMLFCVAL